MRIIVETKEQGKATGLAVGTLVVITDEEEAAAYAAEEVARSAAYAEADAAQHEADAAWDRAVRREVRRRHCSRQRAIRLLGARPDIRPVPTPHWTTLALATHGSKEE